MTRRRPPNEPAALANDAPLSPEEISRVMDDARAFDAFFFADAPQQTEAERRRLFVSGVRKVLARGSE